MHPNDNSYLNVDEWNDSGIPDVDEWNDSGIPEDKDKFRKRDELDDETNNKEVSATPKPRLSYMYT